MGHDDAQTAARERRALEIFAALCDVAPYERKSALAKECAGDQELHRRVADMLALDDSPTFLEGPAPALRTSDDHLGAFRLVTELGTGGMGTVYLAELTEDAAGREAGEQVALKVIHPHLLETPGLFKRFLREAELGQRVQDDNVARTYDCDAVARDGQHHHFLVMEYVEGQTLTELVSELGHLNEDLCLHIARELTKGIAAIHAHGILHRDLKPDNVLITAAHVVKVMDLGIARLMDEAVRLSQTGQFLGTLGYAAPEQFRGSEVAVDHRADLYSLGVVLYELASGARPFHEERAGALIHAVLEREPRRLSERNPQITPLLDEVVHCLLEKDPDRRFDSAAALHEVLEQGEESAWWRARLETIEAKQPGPRRLQIPRTTDLYGREKELATLGRLFTDATQGEGRVLLVDGEAGVGKSRLVDEFVARARGDGLELNFLFGSYPPGGAAIGSGAFSAAYRDHLGPDGLTENLEPYMTSTPGLLDDFAAVLRGEPGPGDGEALEAKIVHTLFVNTTRALASERPTIVLIDDLHFAPAEGRALFAALSLSLTSDRVLLVGTARSGFCDDWLAEVSSVPHASRMSLARLGPKFLFELLKESFQSERLAESLGMRIAAKSDGNPFFALEIIRSMRESGLLVERADGSWHTSQVIEKIEIPSSILDLILVRLRALSLEQRDLLEVACCIGFRFDPSVIADVLHSPRLPVLKRCAQIEQIHQLIRSAGRGYTFDHHQIQEAIYQGMHPQLREEYHAAIAGVIAARVVAGSGAPSSATATEIAEHAFRGGLGELGLRHLDLALRHLESVYDNGRSIALSDIALDVPQLSGGADRARVLLSRCGPLNRLGRRDEAIAGLAEAAELADGAGDVDLEVRARAARGDLLTKTARYPEARADFERALAAEGAGTESYLDARIWLSALDQIEGRYEEAEQQMRDALELAEREGSGRHAVLAMRWLSGQLLLLGRYDEARRFADDSRALARKLGDEVGERTAAAQLGLMTQAQGKYEESARWFEEYLQNVRATGDRHGEVTARINLGNIAKALGRYDEAAAHQDAVPAIARELGARESEAIALVNVGIRRVLLGDREGARESLEACLALSREIGSERVEGYALEGLGLLAQQEGAPDEAERRYAQALTLRSKSGYRIGIAAALYRRGALWASEEAASLAIEDLRHANLLAVELEVPTYIVLSTCRLALLVSADAEDALATFETYAPRMPHADRMDARFLLWQLDGDRRHLDDAHALLQGALESVPEEARAAMVDRVPLHRAIMDASSA